MSANSFSFVCMTPYRGFAHAGPHWGTSVPQTAWVIALSSENSRRRGGADGFSVVAMAKLLSI